eukprot:CAMPEP_0183362962 /NCGR_PEP_ID=MMETSP0164_2-20130417/72579_1 /TAXON_ID=221442 /ORGANISM="Coccolithus pelagicus ssp braarudi, Strain PLY182g" /LENGTH=148 /DNA_ID=CAMNT_0025537959 /DNA_START=166 /DNA_END=610 /DNA_ORIENTATION=-
MQDSDRIRTVMSPSVSTPSVCMRVRERQASATSSAAGGNPPRALELVSEQGLFERRSFDTCDSCLFDARGMTTAVVARTAVGPITTAEDLVTFLQNDLLVLATPFLLWQPAPAVGGVAQVGLPQQAMLGHFVGLCDRDLADPPTILSF